MFKFLIIVSIQISLQNVQTSTWIAGSISQVMCATDDTSTGIVWNVPLDQYNESNLKTKYFPSRNVKCKEEKCFRNHSSYYVSGSECSWVQTEYVLDERWEDLKTYFTNDSISEHYLELSLEPYANTHVIPFSIRAEKTAQICIGCGDVLRPNQFNLSIVMPSSTDGGILRIRFCEKSHCSTDIKTVNLEYVISPFIWKHYKLLYNGSCVNLRYWMNGTEVDVATFNQPFGYAIHGFITMMSVGTALWKLHKYNCIVLDNPVTIREPNEVRFYVYVCAHCNLSINSDEKNMTISSVDKKWHKVDLEVAKVKMSLRYSDVFGPSSISLSHYIVINNDKTTPRTKRIFIENFNFYENCDTSCQLISSGNTLDFGSTEHDLISMTDINWIANWTNRKFCDDNFNCSTYGKLDPAFCTTLGSFSSLFYYIIPIICIMIIILITIIIIRLCRRKKNKTKPDILIEQLMSYRGLTNDQDEANHGIDKNRRIPIPPIRPVIEEINNAIKIDDFDNYIQNNVEGKLKSEFHIFCKDLTTDPNYMEIMYSPKESEYSKIILEQFDDGNYIELSNASYVATYHDPKFFITADNARKLEPKVFWRVIWQEQIENILCLDDDLNAMRKIIPLGPKFSCSKMKITFKYSGKCANYDWYLYQINYAKQRREVTLIHFHEWHEHIPLCSQNLVGCLQKLLKIDPHRKRRVFIHCSKNTNRIGTLVLCDHALRQAAAEGVINILNALHKLYRVMPNLMNSLDYYKLVYVAVNEVLINAKCEIPCREMAESFKQLKTSSFLKLQIRLIKNCVKNLDQGEHHYANTGVGKIGLISVIEVDCFRTPGKYLVTQYPEKIQTEQFWTYVSNAGIEIIVSLNKSISTSLFSCPYVQQFSVEEFNDFDVLKIGIQVSRFITELPKVTVIQMKTWPAKEIIPNNTSRFVQFVVKSHEYSKGIKPVMVLCCDGIGAVGLYAGVSYVIGRINYDKKCSVAQAVEVVRRNCSAFLRTEAQISYLYESAYDYITKFEIADYEKPCHL